MLATYAYDTSQNSVPVSVTISGNGVTSVTTSFEYDIYGNLTSTDGPIPGTADKSMTFYDKLNRSIGTIGADPDGTGVLPRQAVRLIYNDLGQVETQTTGTTTGLSLSALNSMTELQTQRNSYYSGETANLKSTTLEVGASTFSRVDYEYDGRNRVTCSALRMNPAALNGSVNSACTVSSGMFGPDRVTKRTYDVASRVTETTTGFGTTAAKTETAQYYSYGPLEYITDGNGNPSRFAYDGFTRPKYTYYPNASGGGYNPNDHIRYDYNASGQLYRTRQRDGQIVTNTLNAIGQATFVNVPGSSEDMTLSYDIAGRMTNISKSGNSISYAYDGFGRRTSETTPDGTISYQYDNFGRPTRTTYPGNDNFYVTYDYFTAGQLKSIKENGSILLASYTYDSQGRRKTITRGSSSNVTTYNYDVVSRLTSLSNNLAGTNRDQTLSYTYTPSGQLNSKENSNPVYDPTLIAYDEDYLINDLNQLLSFAGTNYGYDTAGNLTSAAGRTYGYDYANRLTSANTGTGGNATLTYDVLSRLRTVAKAGSTARFGYDGLNMISEHDGSTNAMKARYVHGPGSEEPLVRYTYGPGGTPTKHWYVTDRKGSVIGLTTASGTSIAVNKYSHYGKPSSSNEGRFQYTGQVWLEEVELYYYKARFYDPRIKRFLNPDPIGYGDGMNLYAYVGGDPVNMTDPSGLTGEEEDVVVGTGSKWGGFGPGGVPTYFSRGGIGGTVYRGALFADFVITAQKTKKGLSLEKPLNDDSCVSIGDYQSPTLNALGAFPGAIVLQGELSFGYGISGSFRRGPLNLGGAVDAGSWRIRSGTEATDLVYTESEFISATFGAGRLSGGINEGRTSETTPGDAWNQNYSPMEAIPTDGFFGFGQGVQFLIGFDAKAGIDVDEIVDAFMCDLR